MYLLMYVLRMMLMHMHVETDANARCICQFLSPSSLRRGLSLKPHYLTGCKSVWLLFGGHFAYPEFFLCGVCAVSQGGSWEIEHLCLPLRKHSSGDRKRQLWQLGISKRCQMVELQRLRQGPALMLWRPFPTKVTGNLSLIVDRRMGGEGHRHRPESEGQTLRFPGSCSQE